MLDSAGRSENADRRAPTTTSSSSSSSFFSAVSVAIVVVTVAVIVSGLAFIGADSTHPYTCNCAASQCNCSIHAASER